MGVVSDGPKGPLIDCQSATFSGMGDAVQLFDWESKSCARLEGPSLCAESPKQKLTLQHLFVAHVTLVLDEMQPVLTALACGTVLAPRVSGSFPFLGFRDQAMSLLYSRTCS